MISDDLDEAMIARISQHSAEHFGALMGIDNTERLEQGAGQFADNPFFGG